MTKIYLLFIIFLVFYLPLTSAFVLTNDFGDFITGATVIINKPPISTLRFPNEGHIVRGNPISLGWTYTDTESNPQENYLLQIDDDRKFYSPYTFAGKNELEVEVHLPSEGLYYWRVRVKDAYGWGGWSDIWFFYFDPQARICNDGTSFWRCSEKLPKYCNGGVLEENCQECGCNINEKCLPSGSCSKLRCSDGTIYGRCSVRQPLFCQEGVLKEVCSLCACSNDKDCKSDGTCETKVIFIDEVDDIIEKTPFFSTFIQFFKKFFTLF